LVLDCVVSFHAPYTPLWAELDRFWGFGP
jgi:hypothetical protein